MNAYHPTDTATELSKDTFGYEPVQYLAKQLFGLAERSVFTQIATPLDPRGYLDLYGEDPEQEHELGTDRQGFRYHTLACYFDHISFILEGDIDCILTPEQEGILLQIVDEGAENPLVEKHIHTRDDLINVIANYLSIAEKEEAEER